MPSHNLDRVKEKGAYSHIYNKGINKRAIFPEKEDYEAFLSYLQEYLSPPKDANSIKTVFKVHGHTFKGIPHQPKNYFNQIELIAYRLVPDQFDLVLHQLTKNAIEKLIRSLCTKYVIYFNKKYKRTGPLFEGPYKSVIIPNGSELSALRHDLHNSSSYSSSQGFLNPQKVSLSKSSDQQIPVSRTVTVRPRAREIVFAFTSSALFFILFPLGIRNVKLAEDKNRQLLQRTKVLSEAIIETTPTVKRPQIAEKVQVIDGALHVSIRETPTTDSASIGKANGGDIFEFISTVAGWYEIKLPTGQAGFISDQFILPD